MIQRLSDNIFILFIFMLTFGIILYGAIGFDFTDELCALILFGIFGIFLFHTPNWSFNKGFLITIFIFIFYFCYSLYIESNTKKAIAADMFVQIKPYLAYFCTFAMMPLFNNPQKKLLKQICILFWIFLIPIGIIGAINENSFKITMGHPAYFASAIVCISTCYLYCSDFTWKDKIIFIILLSLGILSGRAKFYGFFAFASFLILYFSNINNFKLNFKNGFIITLMISVMLFVAWKKIDLYFYQALTNVTERDMVARYVLYATSPLILEDYFPFGSGLASFGTYYSGVYYSDIYLKYGIDGVWGITKNHYSFIADTYYPSLAQFGIVGVLFYIFFWLSIFIKALKYNKQIKDTKLILMVVMIIGYFGIEGTTDSTFTTHRGFFILMLLGLIVSDLKYKYINKQISRQ